MFYDTIIIGAGPAGIQLGYFLKRDKRNFIIIEQNECAGSFFTKFPHTGKLISINKRFTGYSDPDFNLRHDWNSLLSEDGPLFTSYSKEYYPNRCDLSRYLHDFSTFYSLPIQYKCKIIKIETCNNNNERFTITVQNDVLTYTCQNLVMATGLSPKIPKSIIESCPNVKHYSQYPKDYFTLESTLSSFTNKSLAIIGDGNSAFEIGNHLLPYCSSIVIFGKIHDVTPNKNNHAWSLSTNYSGDVRALYLGFFDTFILKSLNAIAHLPNNTSDYKIIYNENKYYININYSDELSCYDHLILATGWEFDDSVFDFKIDKSGNLPKITPEYESTSHQGLYFIGSLSHSLDYKKSSGGFIHGFRYLIRYFYQLHYQESFPVVYFPLQFDLEKINWNTFTNELFSYLNRTSAMYQMHGIIGTIFYKKNNIMNIFYDVSINLYHFTVHKCNPLLSVSEELVFIITFEYGKVKNNLVNKIAIRNHGNDELLRPVVRIYKQHKLLYEFHFEEDIYGEFIDYNMYHQKFIDILEKWY